MTTATLPGPTAPRALQGARALLSDRRGMNRLRARYGPVFAVDLPIFGRAVVLSDAAAVKQLFTTSPDLADNLDVNLGRVLGPGSFFALTGQEHRKQRKLLVPPFHGRRLAAYERIIEEEALAEFARWPQGRSFATLPSTMRITLNIILRAVFGAEGAEFDRLRTLLPRLVTLGSRLAAAPAPKIGPWDPWGRFRAMRAEYDAVVDRMISDAEARGGLDERDDVLALMLQSRYDDGSRMSRAEIADQLLTLLSAGHETTATTLAWTVERLRRHPDALAALVSEVDSGGSEVRTAALTEVQRTRPAVDLTGRQVRAEQLQLGDWTFHRGDRLLVSIELLHNDPELFPEPERFDPARFLAGKPDLHRWIPFGGGVRRCIGAAFATTEMDVVLRAMLREFELVPTTAAGERWRSRGVAAAPSKGGRAVVRRRSGS